ncbi:hypothetical protein ACSLOD_28080, partial [Escherichia coli]
SSQAFREYLKKLPPDNTIPPALTDEHVPLYIRRLEYYRLLYRAQREIPRPSGFGIFRTRKHAGMGQG